MVGKTALGKYRLLRPLGRGSNAEVFLAEPVGRPGLHVVVKRVHDHVAAHPKFRQLFDAEVQSMANFHHPYAVRMIDASTADPIGPCMALEYVPGVTLEDLLAKTRTLDLERVGRLLGYFCHALQAAHNAGIVHRDLKPSNLMVTGVGTPGESLKVMDFGFAGFADKPHIHLAELTGHGPIYAMGTPGYVSPEMIRGDRVDGRSDLYSVGVILFEMLLGRLPFVYQTQDKLLTAHIKESPPAFRTLNRGDIPPGIEATAQLALSKYPNERQQTAQDIVEMYGRSVGVDLWAATAPEGYTPPPTAAAAPVPTPPPGLRRGLTDPYKVSYEFDAFMPERLAAAKLRGFVEDIGAVVVASEPGLIRMRVGVPAGYDPDAKGSSVFGWLLNRRPAVAAGREPIGLDLHMNKPDPSQTRLSVVAEFGPVRGYEPRSAPNWRDRCDKLHQMLRQYLGT